MNYNFLSNESLIGLEFFNPEEYRLHGIVYTIIDQDDKFIDIEWYDKEWEDEDNSSIDIDTFIKNLNRDFYRLTDKSMNHFLGLDFDDLFDKL